jgi:hypothetical protein
MDQDEWYVKNSGKDSVISIVSKSELLRSVEAGEEWAMKFLAMIVARRMGVK